MQGLTLKQRRNDDVGYVFVASSLPLIGQSESAGRHQLQLASCQSLEHLEQILFLPPGDRKTNTAKP